MPRRPAPARFPARRQELGQQRGGRGQAGAGATRSAAQGLALTAGSPPRCYTVIPPGRAGVFCRLGAPGGGRGAGPARSQRSRVGFAAGARGRGRRVGGRGRKLNQGRRAQPVEGDVGACNASTATHRTRSAPQQNPREGWG